MQGRLAHHQRYIRAAHVEPGQYTITTVSTQCFNNGLLVKKNKKINKHILSTTNISIIIVVVVVAVVVVIQCIPDSSTVAVTS